MARAVRRAHELAPRVPGPDRPAYALGNVAEQVARRLGLSAREASRYLRVLKAPGRVQELVRGGELRLTVAERTAGLAAGPRARLEAVLRAGEDPAAAIGQFAQVPSARHRSAPGAWAALVRGLRRGLADLGDRAGHIRVLTPEDALVEQAVAVLGRVRAGARVLTAREHQAELRARRGRPAAAAVAPADTGDVPTGPPRSPGHPREVPWAPPRGSGARAARAERPRVRP